MPAPIDRRAFLGLAISGTAGSALAPTKALAGISAPQPRSVQLAMPGVFAQESAVLNTAFTWSGKWTPSSGWPAEKLLRQSIATCLWTGHHRSLTRDERQSEAFIETFDRRADGMANTLYAAALELDSLDEAACTDLDATLSLEPELLEQARASLLSHADAQDLPPKVQKRFDRAFDEFAWRMKKQGIKAIADDLVGKLDRVAKREDTDWRTLAREAADQDFVLGREEEAPAAPQPHAAVEQYSHPERRWRDMPKTQHNYSVRAKRQGTAAFVLLGVAVGIVVVAGLAFGPFGLVFGATPGIILIIAAMVVALASVRNAEKAKKATQR